jgi:hypothetical protein
MVDDESPSPPVMPSFASLRDPRRRTAVDLLVPAAPAAPRTPPARPTGAPRPPEWSDLWLLGRHVTWSLAGLPRRVMARQLSCLRSVLGR